MHTPWRAALVGAALAVAMVLANMVALPRGGEAAALWINREVHGYHVAMAIESILDPAERDPMHAQEFDHRVSVKIARSDDGAPANIESVALDVAELGYSGRVMPLAPASGGDGSVFQGVLRMARGTRYRVLVHFRAIGSPATHEASYEYRHHH